MARISHFLVLHYWWPRREFFIAARGGISRRLCNHLVITLWFLEAVESFSCSQAKAFLFVDDISYSTRISFAWPQRWPVSMDDDSPRLKEGDLRAIVFLRIIVTSKENTLLCLPSSRATNMIYLSAIVTRTTGTMRRKVVFSNLHDTGMVWRTESPRASFKQE